MSYTVQGICFLVAVVCFLLAAAPAVASRVNLVAVGLAFVAFVFMWNSFAAN